MTTAYDYSAGRISPAALIAAGVRTVMRYVSTPGNPKNITAAEYRELTEAGITVGLVYETTAEWMLGGYSAGLAAARSARAQAVAVGYPSWWPIWYAADFDADFTQAAAVLDCLHGCADAEGNKGLVALYGGYRVVECALIAGFGRGWQTSAWSGGRWTSPVALRQTGEQAICDGVQVDINELAGELFPAPTTQPAAEAALEEDDDMAMCYSAPRSAAANATRDIFKLESGKYLHVPGDGDPSYGQLQAAGVKTVVISYALHQAHLAAYGGTPVAG